MTQRISDYFIGIGAKRLSEVEIMPDESNQHEFNGISGFKQFFGNEKKRFRGTFIFMSDQSEEPVREDASLTWYDARERHPTRSEHRLYYTTNTVIEKAAPGDLLIIGWDGKEKLLVIVASANSNSEQQLLWLFGLEEVKKGFIFRDFSKDQTELGFAGKYILSELGIETEEEAPDFREKLQRQFGNTFPSTKDFSDYSRSTLGELDPLNDPDGVLMAWLTREELLFKTLETEIVRERLKKGFGKFNSDVNEFISFSLSVQNRRKSRAGFAFENNLVHLFSLHNLKFSRGSITERNNKPDFIFPSIDYYHTPNAEIDLLTMLGVKTTAKDRWRQILAEAAKIPSKHLITLEPAISRNQTEEMKANNLHLIIPAPLLPTYTNEQQKEILTVQNFITLLQEKQNRLIK